MTNQLRVQDLDHLGIVAGIIDDLGLVEQLNGLGFVSVPLYLFETFFRAKQLSIY